MENEETFQYTPIQPKQPEQPKAEYVLKDDVTHKPSPKRGSYVITDTKGRTFKMTHQPNSSCRKCYGRGYTGFNLTEDKTIICSKCYPSPKR